MNELPTGSDTAAAVKAGRETMDAKTRVTWVEHPSDPKIRVPLTIDGDSNLMLDLAVLEELDRRFAERPRAVVARLTEVDAYIAYLNRWGSDATVVYADTAAMSFVAVLDDHPSGDGPAAARTHRATYACPRSSEWNTWTELDGKPQSQTKFADFVEARLEDLVSGPNYPAPIEVLQVGRALNILTKGEFRREINPTNGDSIFVCKTETDAKSTQIPRAFLIAVPVFDGGDRYQLEARVRFTLEEGRAAFSYTLHRRGEIERDAFNEVRQKIATETGRLVLAGTP